MPERGASSDKVPSSDLIGELWKASCTLDSGAKEMGISYLCTCQSLKSCLQERGEANINSKELWLSMSVSKAKGGPIGQTVRGLAVVRTQSNQGYTHVAQRHQWGVQVLGIGVFMVRVSN